MPLEEYVDKTRIFRNLLKVKALSYFDYHLRRRLEAEDLELLDNELIELVIRELYIGLDYIPNHAIRVQMYYITGIKYPKSNTPCIIDYSVVQTHIHNQI
jgi:hypothetical protein